jgi:hypothetical protein
MPRRLIPGALARPLFPSPSKDEGGIFLQTSRPLRSSLLDDLRTGTGEGLVCEAFCRAPQQRARTSYPCAFRSSRRRCSTGSV